VTDSVLAACILKTFVLPLSTFRPTREKMAASSLVFSCLCCWLGYSSARLSAKFKSSNCVHSVHWIPLFPSLCCACLHNPIDDQKKEKRDGDSKQPCLTPVFSSKRLVRCPLSFTLQHVPSWLLLTRLI